MVSKGEAQTNNVGELFKVMACCESYEKPMQVIRGTVPLKVTVSNNEKL